MIIMNQNSYGAWVCVAEVTDSTTGFPYFFRMQFYGYNRADARAEFIAAIASTGKQIVED